MPLKPKNGLLPARTEKTSSNSKVAPKKTKSAGKSVPLGKKPGKKAPRAQDGFELYSGSKEDAKQRNAKPPTGITEPLRTLVEDWMTQQDIDSSMSNCSGGGEMMHMVKRHYPDDSSAAFNKRLVSSTPDPERLLDERGVDIPERDTGDGSAGMMSARLTAGGTVAHLTDSERLRVRQQLDSALIEEAQCKNKNLQEQWMEMEKNRQAMGSLGPPSAPSQGQAHLKRRLVPVPASSAQDTRPAMPRRALTKSGADSLTHKSIPVRDMSTNIQGGPVIRGNNTYTVNSTPQGPATSTWHDIMATGLQARASDIGVFHHFLNRDSADLPLNLKPGQGPIADKPVFAPQSTDAVPNMSMGFSPYKGNPAASLGRSSYGFSPGSNLMPANSHARPELPLAVSTDVETMDLRDHRDVVHMATPACSPVKTSARSVQSSHSAQHIRNVFCPTLPGPQSTNTNGMEIAGELRTPASSPEAVVSRLNFPGSGEVSHNVSSRQTDIPTHPHQPVVGQRKTRAVGNAGGDSFTCDGYYINGSTNSARANEDTPQPRPFTPSPMQPPTLPGVGEVLSSDAALLNQNNNSDSYSRQTDANQNMHIDMRQHTLGGPQQAYGYPPSSHDGLAYMDQSRPGREAMAEMEFAGLAFGAEGQMMLSEDMLEPTGPCPSPMPHAFADRDVLVGPRRLRSLITELKQTCAIDGDMEVCHMVQQINDLVELLPQLKPTFNLETEIGLALQPLRSECSQLRRRLRILNQQLRERERQEKEGLDPKIQVEILNLQTENMELQKGVTEAEQSCHKLNLFISGQQQQVQALQCQLQQKDHEKLVARQENVQQVNRLNREVEKMSLRNQSLQSKLAAADCQNNVLDLNLKQSNMEVVQLQDTMGRMKQAVVELMQHMDSDAQGSVSLSSAKVQGLPSFRVLNNMLKSTSFTSQSPRYDNTISSSRGPLDISGNQRTVRFPQTDMSAATRPFHSHEAPRKPSLREASHSTGANNIQETLLSKDSGNKSLSLTKEALSSRKLGSAGDTALSENSLSTGPLPPSLGPPPPSPLTLEAVAAHNQHLDVLSTGDLLSCHSWDGGGQHRASLADQSLPYHSDPESLGVPSTHSKNSAHKHHNHIQRWSTGVEEERRQGVQKHNLSGDKSENAARKSNDTSERRTSEVGSVPTLSEFPVSEKDLGESAKSAAVDRTRHSVTDYFKKYPESKGANTTAKRPQSPPRLTLPNRTEEAATPATKETPPDKRSPTVSSPNSSLTHSISNTSQKDYFYGTELDLTLSTIPEDGLSSVTGFTGTSMSTAMSLDDRKFREGVDALDEKINKCKESLQIWKKTFA